MAGCSGSRQPFGRLDIRSARAAEHEQREGLFRYLSQVWRLCPFSQGTCQDKVRALSRRIYVCSFARRQAAFPEHAGTGPRRKPRGKLKGSSSGFADTWERAYIELDEFELALGSMSVYHFGARWPCFSKDEPIPLDWWHLRLHIYCGCKEVRPSEAVTLQVESGSDSIVNIVTEAVSEFTVDLHQPAGEIWRCMLPALDKSPGL
jgi:hypothetical protein